MSVLPLSYTVVRKWCHSNNYFAESASHHGGEKLAEIIRYEKITSLSPCYAHKRVTSRFENVQQAKNSELCSHTLKEWLKHCGECGFEFRSRFRFDSRTCCTQPLAPTSLSGHRAGHQNITLPLRRPRLATQIARPTYDCPLERLPTSISTSHVAHTISTYPRCDAWQLVLWPETGCYGTAFSNSGNKKKHCENGLQ